jgi:hypothetical protein
LLQAAGRVGRDGEYIDAKMMTFCLKDDELLKPNPGLKNAETVLRGYLESGVAIDSSLVTEAIEKEIKLYGLESICEQLTDAEKQRKFPCVSEKFKVIDDDTRIVVVNEELVQDIRYGKIDWRYLQQNSLQIATYKLTKMKVREIKNGCGIYYWHLGYNDFIGYMDGIVGTNSLSKGTLIV